MIDEFNTREKAAGLFRKPGDCEYLMVYSTYPTSALILGGAGTAMTENVDSAYGGYIVRVSSGGLDLCPLSKIHQNNGIASPSRMKVANGRMCHISSDEIERWKNRPANGIFVNTRTITFETAKGKKYVWQVNKKEKALPYHEDGYRALEGFFQNI